MSDVEKATIQEANHSPYRGADAAAPVHVSGIANPGPLGLFSFASTNFILSLYNIGARGVAHPNAVVGMALGCGGLTQLLAGIWEFPKGNTFGATVFTSYGAFWLSYAIILIPGSGIGAAYVDPVTGVLNTDEFNSAVGIYLMTWFTVTMLFCITALRKNIGFIALLAFLSITFLTLGVHAFTGVANVSKAAGALGIVTTLVAYYIGLSDLLAAEKASVVSLPIGVFKHD